MATARKPTNSNSRSSTKKPAPKKTDPITSELTGDFATAKDLYQKNFPQGALPQLDASRSIETQNLLKQRQAYSDPTSGAFAGLNSPSITAELSRLNSQADPNSADYVGNIDSPTNAIIQQYRDRSDPNSPNYAGNIPPEIRAIMDQYKSSADPNSANFAGRMSPETQAIISQYRSAADPTSATYAGKRSGDMQDVISRLKGGLEGYTSAESQGFREQAAKGLNDQFRTDQRRMQIQQGRSGVRGGAAGAQLSNLDRQRTASQGELERDLFLKNADEKQKRLATYTGVLGGAEADEYGRANKAMGDYGTYYSNAEGQAYGRGREALTDYGAYASNATNQAQDRGRQALGDYGTYYSGANNEAYNRGQTAQGQYRDFLGQTDETAYNRGQGAIQSYADLLGQTQGVERDANMFNISQAEKTDARDVGSTLGVLGVLGTRRNNAAQNRILGGNKSTSSTARR